MTDHKKSTKTDFTKPYWNSLKRRASFRGSACLILLSGEKNEIEALFA